MSDERTRAAVTVTGVVQGVGFRPFVYRTAVDNDLGGWVKNTGDAGVEIRLEGGREAIDSFLDRLRHDPPPLARVETVDVAWEEPADERDFEIVPSSDADGGSGTIPPDTAMCDACLEDMRDPDSRYHDYWATSCVDCGPRYTVIRSLPYDRPTTSMDAFPMCEACREEYEDPADRRYHAQTIACPDCGPSLELLDEDGNQLADDDETAIEAACDRLAGGDLVAIKGIGGAHLACDATDPDVVERLRERTGRPEKPFAVMAPDIESVESFASVSSAERDALTDTRRPVVLLEEDGDQRWLEAVSPGLHTVGVMLPYAGLHHLLFDHVGGPLVMTSANMPGTPMATTTEGILEDLGGVVDAALVHDREIVARCDDSVVRFAGGQRRFVRRSRGWVPQSVPRWPAVDGAGDADAPDVLALGAEFDATVALTQDDDVYPSQYIGDVDSPETLSYLTDTVAHLQELLGIDPGVVACDRHPDFLTTEQAKRYAERDGLEGPVAVQHHHAHAASLLAEHERERAVVVTADGTGYGPDGTIWGGEVLDATLEDYDRVGGLAPFRLPGGSAAVESPARILASLLDDPDRIDELLLERGVVDRPSDAATIRAQVEQEVNSPVTTSMGRALDVVSALLGVCSERTYEGEPAMKLEAAAAEGQSVDLSVPRTTVDGRPAVDPAALVGRLDAKRDERSTADLAATAQETLARGLADIAIEAATDRGVDAVGFTGGVAYNDAITRTVHERVRAAGLEWLSHEHLPPGDGGIAVGQATVATARWS
ncbi:carbamoyltransferase HypF [Halapricum hydrolyticum]|uniref:Carbamoyltransferase n=1 Tax=Halapricum hydrolyticum TaxID=2979991 RepID=A0AAE3I8J2_9EURY|nr:carbamoyltransferase HypF [Halapricum hydrolyticum]MCU4716730.1 carbamoyltransferase HypF [Halapricum hydrolyticum]MCU4725665.1 carbamoyltransferase HypF [Halapricum hydrolyticum]